MIWKLSFTRANWLKIINPFSVWSLIVQMRSVYFLKKRSMVLGTMEWLPYTFYYIFFTYVCNCSTWLNCFNSHFAWLLNKLQRAQNHAAYIPLCAELVAYFAPILTTLLQLLIPYLPGHLFSLRLPLFQLK